MTRIKLVRRDAFREDLIEHFVTIAREQPDAAEHFAETVERLLVDLRIYPESGRQWHPTDRRLTGVRFRVVSGFNVLIFYLIRDDKLIALRALHGARGDIQTLLADDMATND